MSKQCPSCYKLAGLETQDPEVASLELCGSTVSTEVRLVRVSTCCGDEMKEAVFEVCVDLDDAAMKNFEGHIDLKTLEPLHVEGEEEDLHELEIDEESVEYTERCEGRGRGVKTFYGFSLQYSIRCACSDKTLYEGTLDDEMQASHMEELS